MPEYNLSTQLLKSKTSKIISLVLVVVLFAGVIYARANGVKFHIKSGQIKGNQLSVTEYLDNQDSIAGTVTTTIPDGRGSFYIVVGGDTVVDVTQVAHAVNLQFPFDHFVKGDFKPGVHVKGIVRKSSPIPALSSYNFNNWFEVWPSDPFYIAVQ